MPRERTTPLITVVVARAANGVIGAGNTLPWRLVADLAQFKSITLGKPVVIGRKTFESIGRPLPFRRNIVVTRTPAWAHLGCEVATSLDDALALCGDADEVMIVGGAQLYSEALPRAQRAHITEIHRAFEGDVVFPTLDGGWREVSRKKHTSDAGLRFDFVVYER